MEEAYSSLPVRLPEANPEVQRLYEDWLEGEESPRVQQTLHTHYNSHTQSLLNTPGPDMQWWKGPGEGSVLLLNVRTSFTAGEQKGPRKDQDAAVGGGKETCDLLVAANHRYAFLSYGMFLKLNEL